MVDGVDGHVILTTGHQRNVDGIVAKRAIDAGAADKKTKHIVEVGANKLTIFFGSKNVAKGDQRIEGGKIEFNPDGILNVEL